MTFMINIIIGILVWCMIGCSVLFFIDDGNVLYNEVKGYPFGLGIIITMLLFPIFLLDYIKRKE